MTRTPDDLVRMEVHYCVSSLVSTLANGYGQMLNPERMRESYKTAPGADLAELTEQAFELARPIDDWEEAAFQEGWRMGENGIFENIETHETDSDTGEWEYLCENWNIEPYQREVYEHWIVSDWLADKLEARGEKVDRDFAGMTVWARTTTGQAIAADSVIVSICRDLPGEIEAALAAIAPTDEQYARQHGLEVRHDLHGFYICTIEEGEHEDEGSTSVGFDGRTHWPEASDAWAAAASSARIAARESED